jgi:hypothetical protein
MEGDRALAAMACASRLALGTAFVVAPGTLVRLWTGETAPADTLLARGLGIRDALLGAGALLALVERQPARRWIQAGALSDAVDAAITLAAVERIPRNRRLVFASVASAAAATFAALSVRVR